MTEKRQLEFFLLRYVPKVVTEEFVNIAVVMLEPSSDPQGFMDVCFAENWKHVRSIDPGADIEMLDGLKQEFIKQLEDVPRRGALLRLLEESFSNVVQLSARKGCLADDPHKELAFLASVYLGNVYPPDSKTEMSRSA
jgi:Protein of unknown function (DUF3037)